MNAINEKNSIEDRTSKKKENQEGINLNQSLSKKKKRKGKFKKKSLQNSGGESQFKTAV